MEAKCQCQNCGENIAYPAEMENQEVACPHCRNHTMLAIQPAEKSLSERIVEFKVRHKSNSDALVFQTKCPICNSDSTMSFPMAYKSGTTLGRFGGIGIGLEGDVDLFGGRTSSKTLLASSVSPPSKNQTSPWHFLFFFASAFITVIASLWMVTAEHPPYLKCSLWLLIGIPLLVFSIYLILKSEKEIKKIYKMELANWVRHWICTKCGAQFIP